MKKIPNYVTKEMLDETLNERHYVTEEMLERQLADFFGKLIAYLDKRFDEMEERLDKRFSPMLSISDATQKRMDIVEQETAALSMQTDRHDI